MLSTEPILCALAILNGITLEIRSGSLLSLRVDTIVNAANENLQNHGGIAGQIVNDGGKIIQDECNDIINQRGKIKTGTVTSTGAGSLNYRHIIHTVGPVIENEVTPHHQNLLINSIFYSITKANELKMTSIGIPAISCGIFRYPVDKAALIHIQAFIIYAGNYACMNPLQTIKRVVFSLFTGNELIHFLDALMSNSNTFSYIQYLGDKRIQGLSSKKAFCQLCESLIDDRQSYF